MKTKIYFLISFMAVLQTAFAQQNIDGSLVCNKITREYVMHLPKDYDRSKSFPLVFIFHGGSGNSKQMQRYMGMDSIADKESFINVYPQGINKQWNDGRDFKGSIAANDDVQFINQLLDTLSGKYSVDTRRVFATGISNGGFFSIYLSLKLSDRLLAVAPVCASIPEKIYTEFQPQRPISILLMNGTGDPLVPYNGGEVGGKLISNRGRCISTDKTIERYISIDKTSDQPLIENIPDKNKNDDCSAIKYMYKNGEHNTTVMLIRIVNGGHTLPGASQYLPKFLIGRVCNDFNGNEMIWGFFKNCSPR